MPELVAQIEQPAPVVARQRPVVLAEVRDIVHQRVEPLLVRLRHIAARRILDLAEIAGEGDLLCVGDVLIVKHEDRIAVHPGLDRRDVPADRGCRRSTPETSPTNTGWIWRMETAIESNSRRAKLFYARKSGRNDTRMSQICHVDSGETRNTPEVYCLLPRGEAAAQRFRPALRNLALCD